MEDHFVVAGNHVGHAVTVVWDRAETSPGAQLKLESEETFKYMWDTPNLPEAHLKIES